MTAPGTATLLSGEKKNGLAGSANREIGNPGEIGDPEESDNPGPGWHSRGYLPHFDLHELIQHVTFHLADSLPKTVVAQLNKEMELPPAKKQDAERRKRIEAWIDAGHGSCVLREPVVAAMVQRALSHFDGQRYRLLAWVVMPNHVHVLFQPMHGWTVAKIVASWKKFTARRICDYRKANHTGSQAGSAHGTGDPGAQVWHREYWDRYIRDEEHYRQTVEYIHQNPVKAGLVGNDDDWVWSSAWRDKQHAESGNRGNRNTQNADQEIGDPGKE